MRARRFFAFGGLCIAASACGPVTPSIPDAFVADVSLEDRVFTCDPLRVEPASPRVATDRSVQLRVIGGSGFAPLRIEGETLGAYVEPAGGFRAGSRGGTVTVVATDSNCNLTARASVEIVGPFSVTPERATVMRGGTTMFTAQNVIGPLRYEVFARPAGAGAMGSITAAGVFTAGMVDGEYQIVATDDGAQKSARLVVEVGAGAVLRPRVPVLAVPSGGRVRLDWNGGSGSYRYAVADMARGRVVEAGGRAFFEATGARGSTDVTVTDTASSETARVRVLVGEEASPAPQRRGGQTQAGDMIVADVNGDGRRDLIVGHAERSIADVMRGRFTGRNAGGLLVFHGAADGSFGDAPSTIIEGENTEDRFGSVLLARDVNGDGIDDVMVGVPDSDLGESDRGAFALYLGSRDGLTPTFERVLNGEDINDRFGSSLAVADLNGDDAPELIVGAPNAVRPMDRPRATALRCNGGRVYVYRGITRTASMPVRGVFENVPWQVIDAQAPLSDVDANPACSPFLIGAGRALALIDVDGDGNLDLAVGAPGESHVMGGTASVSHGAVLVYRGVGMAQFERFPAWSIQLPPELRTTNAQFGQALDVIRDGANSALVVRSFTFAAPGMMMGTTLGQSGGFWVFTRAQFMAPLPADMMGMRMVRVVSAASAQSFAYGEIAQRGLGRHATVGDADGDGAQDYIVSGTTSTIAAMPAASGAVYSFSSRALITGMGRVTLPSRVVETGVPMMGTVPTELTGMRVAAIGGAMGTGAGLAVWHGWRDTTITEGGMMIAQPFSGSVEYVGAGAGDLAPRWAAAASRRSISFSLQPSGDRAGASVLLGSLSGAGAVDAVVSAPFAHSPVTMMARASQVANVGAIEAYGAAGLMPLGRFSKTVANGAQQPMVTLDFDGDGTQELAIAERGDTVDTRLAEVPSECKVRGMTGGGGDAGAMAAPLSVGGRGIVRVYKLMGGQFVERWRVISRGETVPVVGGAPQGLRLNGFGASLAAADVDGDGSDDLVVGRPNGTDSNGADVVLGRANAGSTIAYVCNSGTDAYFAPAAPPTETSFFGVSVDGLGDLNGDGCDEVAIGLARNAAGTNPSAAARAGFIVAFGANADAGRVSPRACAFRTAPTILVVPDERNLADNVAGMAATRDNDDVDLAGLPGTMGRVFALGAGDLDGDGAADIAYRTADLAFGPFRGAAVEVISGRHLAQCVTGSCPAALADSFARDGNYRVLGVRSLGAPYRLVAPTMAATVTRWGLSLAIAEVTGDAASELFIGSPDDSIGGDFAGAVYGYRGGAMAFTQAALTADPWLVAVGDVRERGDFGASTAALRSAASGAFLLVGSPLASRLGAGGELGAGYRWRVEVP